MNERDKKIWTHTYKEDGGGKLCQSDWGAFQESRPGSSRAWTVGQACGGRRPPAKLLSWGRRIWDEAGQRLSRQFSNAAARVRSLFRWGRGYVTASLGRQQEG